MTALAESQIHTVEQEALQPAMPYLQIDTNPSHEVLIKEEAIKRSPSATASPVVADAPQLPGARRPPRKSTLTQQQKNQKRQRATQDQLTTLEVEFNKNPTPSAVVRERIAHEINMTERSVQIWFQNRRAKIKNLAKKSIETGEDCDAIPESMRAYLARQALESGKPLVRDLVAAGGMTPFGSGLLMNADATASKVVINHLTCQSLTIGSWRRVGQTALDLVIFYSPAKAMVTYYINAESAGFKIEYPFSYIRNITLDSGDVSSNAEGARQRTGGIVIELNRPPIFTMDPGNGGFAGCLDFTEGKQASQVLIHHLGGHPKVLSGQLAKLVSLDTFRNRHRLAETNPVALSAPVSPVGHRPASQPNHIFHPHHMNAFHDGPLEMGPPAPRGHKRQRSRSVPVAIDFNQLRQPMAPFALQPHNLQPPQMAAEHWRPMHAPVPQYQQGFQPIGPTLRIDISSGFNFDFNPGPMSATTANSSSEFDPGYFPPGPPSEVYSTPGQNTSVNSNAMFLSPMVDSSHVNNPSVSPLSSVSHAEPYIANNSPPLTTFDRSTSQEIYSGSQDVHAGHPFFDDLTPLGEPWKIADGWSDYESQSKQTFLLPFRATGVETPKDDYEFHDMINFGDHIGEHISLSPETPHFSNNSQSSSAALQAVTQDDQSTQHHTG